MSLSPAHLLETATPVAPWCRRLEPLELSLLLIAVPFIGPVRRADFPRRLSDLGITESLVGALYFQRIDRAVEQFVKMGAMEYEGANRERAYRTTAEGFAAIVLNLAVLERDPTLDGTEFELKREIAGALHFGLRVAMASLQHRPPQGDARQFFEQLGELEVLGQSVLSNEILNSAADVQALINRQRQNVTRRLEAVQREASEMQALRRILGAVGLSGALKQSLAQAPGFLSQPEFLEIATVLATSGGPETEVNSRILRYRSYIGYLDGLSELYGKAAPAFNDFTLLGGAVEAPAPKALPARAQKPKPRRSQTARGVNATKRKEKGEDA